MNELQELLLRYNITENGLPAMGDFRLTNERLADDIKELVLEAVGGTKHKKGDGKAAYLNESVPRYQARLELRAELYRIIKAL